MLDKANCFGNQVLENAHADFTMPLFEDSLRFSDKFSLAFDACGEPIFYEFANPGYHVRVSELACALALTFPANRTVPVRTAVEMFLQRAGVSDAEDLSHSVLSAVELLRSVGVLTRGTDPDVMYTEEMVPSYIRSRQIPPEVSSLIAAKAPIDLNSTILDICTGTGEIALRLAERSRNVTGIDLSQPFLNAARDEALRRGLHVSFVRGCGNKLIFSDDEYDVITVSQAFHWLEPRLAVKGIYHVLKPHGTLYFVESKPILSATHPLRALMPFASVDHTGAEVECNRHAQSYAQLFETMKEPEDALAVSGVWTLHERRLFDMDYARARVPSEQLKHLDWGGSQPESVPTADLYGDMYWLLVELRRVHGQPAPPCLKVSFEETIELSN